MTSIAAMEGVHGQPSDRTVSTISELMFPFTYPNLVMRHVPRAGSLLQLLRHVFRLQNRLKRAILTPKSL